MEEVNCASNSLTSIESQTKIGQKQTGDLAESLTMNVLSSHFCTASFVPPCESPAVSHRSDCRTRDQDYYDHSNGVSSQQSPGSDTNVSTQGPAIEDIPSTRLSSSPVTSSLLIEPIPCNSHGPWRWMPRS